MKSTNELYKEARIISGRLRRIQAVAESWPDEYETCALLRERDELQVAFHLCLMDIYDAELAEQSPDN